MAPKPRASERLKIDAPKTLTRAELHEIAWDVSELELENAALRADGARLRITSEPLTYRRGGPHSFFYDIARGVRLADPPAKDRLARHEQEMAVEMPRRAKARALAAQRAYEERFYSTPADRRAMDAFIDAGGTPFERRAVSRTDGAGGYFAPPVYLVDRYAEFAREGSPFAALWDSMPLPAGTSEVNVPGLTVGSGTGPQLDNSPVVTRDIADTLVTAPVRTIAGLADASLQWLDQGQGSGGFGVDDMIYADLTADLHQNADGQLLLGAGGSQNQLLGVWPAGAISAAGGIVIADTTADAWTAVSGTPSIHVTAANLVSLLARIRNRPPQYWIWHPWVWSLYASQVDDNIRPLVNCQCGTLPPGVAGYFQNIPVVTDANIPTTFGDATSAPYMGPITNGQYAAVPGTGADASYTPMLLARPSDMFLFAGDIRLQVMREVLSGSGQVRFMARQYLAAMPNRYTAAATVGSNVNAGGDVTHATLTSQHSGSLLILASSGF